MTYLVDTNVLSELRKGKRCSDRVARWFSTLSATQIFISVLTLGEIRRGVERVRRRDQASARRLERWLERLQADYARNLLPVDQSVADEWGRMNVPDPVPVIDGLLAATAQVHGLTLATRNTKGVARTRIEYINPFVDGD